MKYEIRGKNVNTGEEKKKLQTRRSISCAVISLRKVCLCIKSVYIYKESEYYNDMCTYLTQNNIYRHFDSFFLSLFLLLALIRYVCVCARANTLFSRTVFIFIHSRVAISGWFSYLHHRFFFLIFLALYGLLFGLLSNEEELFPFSME